MSILGLAIPSSIISMAVGAPLPFRKLNRYELLSNSWERNKLEPKYGLFVLSGRIP